MTKLGRVLIVALGVVALSAVQAQDAAEKVSQQLKGLRGVAEAQRPAATRQLALDIRALPAGLPKLKLADALCHLSTEGDAGAETLQAVADTLAQSLTENPLPATGDEPPMPYGDLALLVRYEHVKTSFNDPLYLRALQTLSEHEAEIEKREFTLADLQGKKVSLSGLRGKVVLVNFWATWCPPCRAEMPALDALAARYDGQVVVLSITDEEQAKVAKFFWASKFRPTVLLDPQGTVAKQFYVNGIPKTFVFDRAGKLAGVAIDQRTPRQFMELLGAAGVRP